MGFSQLSDGSWLAQDCGFFPVVGWLVACPGLLTCRVPLFLGLSLLLVSFVVLAVVHFPASVLAFFRASVLFVLVGLFPVGLTKIEQFYFKINATI